MPSILAVSLPNKLAKYPKGHPCPLPHLSAHAQHLGRLLANQQVVSGDHLDLDALCAQQQEVQQESERSGFTSDHLDLDAVCIQQEEVQQESESGLGEP